MDLKKFLNPRSIAIIGASNNNQKIGAQILQNIKTSGWSGRLVPINIHEKIVGGFRAYQKISDFNGPIDLAIIVIPAPLVVTEVKSCALLGIKNIVIISAGFGEMSEAGKQAEVEIKEVAHKYKVNILGPNCLGFINSKVSLNATFANFSPDPKITRRNNIAFLSQSGAIGSAVLDWSANKNIGFSYFVSLGNKAILDENDFLEYLLKDKQTELVVAYLEEIKNGERFMNLVSRLARLKPVAILKAGQTKTGARAALSHTGSMAGETAALLAGLKRAGAIILEDMTELFNLMRLVKKPLRRHNSDLYIISNAGGPLVLAIDEAARSNLVVTGYMDLLGDAQSPKYQLAIKEALIKKKVDNLLILLTPQSGTDVEKIAEVIGSFSKKYPQKLICTSFIGGPAISAGKKILAKYLIPNFDYPEEAVRVLAHYLNHQKGVADLRIYPAPKTQKKFVARQETLDYLESLELLKKYKIPVARAIRIKNNLSAVKYPTIVKIVGPELIHKTEAGAVFKAENKEELKKIISNNKLLANPKNYAIAQEKITDALELIVGFKRDAAFGPIIIVGQGGIYTEVFKDLSLEVNDLDERRALAMIRSLKIYPIIKGVRGQAGYDINSLVKVILGVAKLAKANPQVRELDINPLFLKKKGAIAADGRAVI
jgi:acetyltransferase